MTEPTRPIDQLSKEQQDKLLQVIKMGLNGADINEISAGDLSNFFSAARKKVEDEGREPFTR